MSTTSPITPLHFPRTYSGNPRYAVVGPPDMQATWNRYHSNCGRFEFTHNRLEGAWYIDGNCFDVRYAEWVEWVDQSGISGVGFRTRREAIKALLHMLELDELLTAEMPSAASV